jgi:hypothetical protein
VPVEADRRLLGHDGHNHPRYGRAARTIRHHAGAPGTTTEENPQAARQEKPGTEGITIMDEQAQEILNLLSDAELKTKQLVSDLVRDAGPAEKVERMSLALGNICAAERIIENAKYSKDSYTGR